MREWADFCRARGRCLDAAVHVDTGMNRLGLGAEEVLALAADPGLWEAFHCTLVMSHLACADEQTNPKNQEQRRRFDELRQILPPTPASLANSGGTFLGPEFHYDLVRPGIALFGGRAFVGVANPMQWVVELKARILQVRSVAEGETVGDGASYRAARPMRVATIACLDMPTAFCAPSRVSTAAPARSASSACTRFR